MLDPEVLLLDDPVAGLDAEMVLALKACVEERRAHHPLTVVAALRAFSPFIEAADRLVVLRDGRTRVTLKGRAIRDGEPAAGGPFPLVVISHGYPGNRFLLSHLGENLATKGYVAVSIEHCDSTYDDKGPFGSTLVNRPLDEIAD